MGVSQKLVTGADVSSSATLRLDPKIHIHHAFVLGCMVDLIGPARFGDLASFSNGRNLPRSAYADPSDEPIGLYLSVRGLANYVFNGAMCDPLRESTATEFLAEPTNPSFDPSSSLEVHDREVLITRSRATAPGSAMSGPEIVSESPVVPSGFVIRAALNLGVDPTYVAAILNHPVWRTYTAGLAAGKSQDNLSQELLAEVPIPNAAPGVQAAVAARYRKFLADAGQILDDDARFADECDAILSQVLNLKSPVVPNDSVRSRRVPLVDIAATRTLRLDNRWHSQVHRTLRDALGLMPSVRLGDLIAEPIAKGRQPKWVLDDDTDAEIERGYAVATGSIRFGSVVPDLLKVTSQVCVGAFPVSTGDLLIAMDGDGSIGKAAVYSGQGTVTVDSHLSRVRISGGEDLTKAICCWLNSSWGMGQTNSMMSGATGQTQLGAADLCDVVIPHSVAESSTAIAAKFDELVNGYVPPAQRIRELLCACSFDVSSLLIESGVISDTPSRDAHWSLERTTFLLKRLYSSVR